MNGDYITLDQAVIDREIQRLQGNRLKAKEILRDASKNAGGNYDIVVFRNMNAGKRKRIVRALEDLRIFWCEIDGEILTNRHELYGAVLPKE